MLYIPCKGQNGEKKREKEREDIKEVLSKHEQGRKRKGMTHSLYLLKGRERERGEGQVVLLDIVSATDT